METLALTRLDVTDLLALPECIDAVERAFADHARGLVPAPGVMGMHLEGGGFHIKAAKAGDLFATKVNGNFAANESAWRLPRIQGLIVLCDARHGFPVAVMDSTEITAIRTAAATGVAARALARGDASVVTIAGCGRQSR